MKKKKKRKFSTVWGYFSTGVWKSEERERKKVINKVILQGRLTKDPEMRMTTNETAGTGISIAVQRPVARGSEKTADFINCVAFGKTAELLAKHFTKGKEIAVVGSWRNETWERQDGTKQIISKVYISEIHFCGAKTDSKPISECEQADGFIQADDYNLPF